MHLTQKANFIERIIYDKNGRLVRATFCVYQRDGRIKARIVDLSYINQITGKILTLPGLFKKIKSSKKTGGSKSTASPYFSFNLLSFLGSKPRAPTA